MFNVLLAIQYKDALIVLILNFVINVVRINTQLCQIHSVLVFRVLMVVLLVTIIKYVLHVMNNIYSILKPMYV